MKSGYPSINPANKDSLVGTFRLILKKILQNTDDMLPCQVVSFDAQKKTARVQPLIMMTDTLGNNISRAHIYNVPILQMGGGDFFLSFPTKIGDFGFIKANDRDISQFLANFTEAPPPTNQIKNFSNAVFIPAVLKDYTIDSSDADNVVLQNLSGSVKISLSSDTITLKAPKVVIENTEKITVGDAEHLTNLYLWGAIEASGTITPNAPPPP